VGAETWGLRRVGLTSVGGESKLGSLAVMPSHLIASLVAGADAGGGGAALLQLGILLLIPFAMYFFLIRPQRRRMREQQDLQRSIQVGDEIITTSGIFGTITGEDGPNRFWLEIDDDVQIRIARAAIQGRASDDIVDDDADDLESANADDD
jgi:preprotein translocase subunit YajC